MIQVIERFHKILDYVAETPESPKTVSELAGLIDVSSPACSNIIRTMVALGYLESVKDRKGYILGPTPFHLTRNRHPKQYLIDTAKPLLESLSEEIKEFLVLVAGSNGKRVELLKLEYESMVQVKATNTEGLFTLFGTTTGCLLLSFMSEKDFKRFFYQRKPDEHSFLFDVENYENSLETRKRIVEKGYIVNEPQKLSEEELLNACSTAAFPIFENGKAVAALGTRVPSYRFQKKRKQWIIERCLSTAQKISDLLSS